MKKIIVAALVCLNLAACATNPDGSRLTHDQESNLEYYNRAMFNFSYHLDKAVIKPVAKGYKKVTNQFVRDRVTAFFNNLEEPASALNNVFQGEIKNSGISVGRFLLNSTLGLAGLFDVASGWGLKEKKATFDSTLAKYCVPDGPFFIMPVLGPSTPRYLVGWGVDSYASPMYWALVDVDDDGVDAAVWSAIGLKYLNMRAENMDLLDSLEEGSVDYYETMKSAFMQNRQKFASMCQAKTEDGDAPSYDFDFGYNDPEDDDFAEDME